MNPVFPSQLRTLILNGLLFCLPVLSMAQGWQQSYPVANGFSISKLAVAGDLFNVTLKNGPANANLSGLLADGSQLGFSNLTADCPIGFPGQNFQLSPLEFFNYSINADGDVRLRRIEFVPGDCGNIDQLYFDQTYDLPTASGPAVKAIIRSADGQAVFLGGTYQVFPGNAPPEAFFFVKKINATTGQELWSYAEPTPNATLGNVPDVRFPLAVSDGGVIMMLPATPLTSSVLWRFDGSGNKVFGNVFGAGLDANVNQVLETTDGGFFIRRFDFSSGSSNGPSYSKISGTGSLVFNGNSTSILQNELGSFPKPVTIGTTLITTEGGILLTGKVLNTVAGDNGLYLIKLKSDGSTEWVQFYDGLLPDLTQSVQTADGGFLFAGKLNNELFLFRAFGGQIDTPPIPCTNLLTNPDFSNGLTGWGLTGTVTVNGGAGEICGSAGSLTQVTPAVAGQTFSAGVSAKISGNPLSATATLRFLTAGYMPLPGGDVKSINTGSYAFLNLTATAPIGAAYAQLLVFKEVNGCVQVDAAELCQGTGGGGTGTCQLSDEGVTSFCDSKNTPDPTDDIWYASIQPTGTGLGNSYTISGQLQATNRSYGTPYFFGPFSSATGSNLDITITDEQNGCSRPFTIKNPGSCSGPCQITLGNTAAICNDNGTPNNPTDDFWFASIEPAGTGIGNTFSIFGDIQASNLAYGQAHLFGPFSIGFDFKDFYIVDDENGCSFGGGLSQSSPCSNSPNANLIDLELSLAQPNPNPAQYNSYAVTATITNKSVHGATGVKVSFVKPAGVVYTGGNEYSASQGNFDANGNQIWTVGNLAANSSATLTVNYFLLAGQAPAAYAQVTAHDQQDADSSPANGTPPVVNEDDEASTFGNGGGTQKPDLILSNLEIQNGPLTAGGTISYDFDAANIGSASTNGSFVINAYISTDNVLSSDDIQEGTVFVVNFDAGYSESVSSFTILPFNLPDGNYFLILKTDATDAIVESNENNNLISRSFIVGTGGGSGGGIDLSLDITATSDDPVIYTSKKVVLLINNDGPETATNIKVSFPKPNGTVYTGGNEYTATKGSFSAFGSQIWSIGSLAPGESAALEVSYFFLTSNTLTPYAQVTAADQPDSDSTPGNGICCTPNEDDEADFRLTFYNWGAHTSLKAHDIIGRAVQLQAINPNPVSFGEITVSILSREEGQFDLECYDLFGRLAFSQSVKLEEGRNELRLDVSRLESGTYYLNMPDQNWRNMPIRFIVTRW